MATSTPFQPRVDAGDHLQPVVLPPMRDLLVAAFSAAELDTLLRSLNQRLSRYAGIGTPLDDVVLAVCDAASRANWWRELLVGARHARPRDPALAAFAEEFDLSLVPVETTAQGGRRRLASAALEGKVRAANPLLDIAVWRTRLAEIESRVCRVECPARTARGTGFLVGAGVLMTNYHVVEPLILGSWKAEDVALRFDYKIKPDGVALNSGIVYRLAAAGVLDASPYSASDLVDGPDEAPGSDELDYALLAVDGDPGNASIGLDGAAQPRGWIAMPGAAVMPDFARQRALFIVQHADGRPMQVAMDTDAVTGVFGNGTRLRYTTNTLEGSSGSPCFSLDGDLLAMHHSGDPKYPGPKDPARYNQGILLPAIVKLLALRGKQALLG